jgi:hypothetical protein
MTVKGRRPTWAVIVPSSAEWLQATARDAHRELFPPNPNDPEDESPDDWEVTAGIRRYTAVRGNDPSGEDALLVAPLISQKVTGTVYAAVVPEHLRGSYAWEGGQSLGEVATSPEELAEELGVPFPKPDAPS